MTLPKSIKIGTTKWYIDADSRDLPVENIGLCLGSKGQIRIASDVGVEAKPLVLVHELLHALLYSYGIRLNAEDDDNNFMQEELLVDALALPLLEVIRSNPKLLKYLVKEGKRAINNE